MQCTRSGTRSVRAIPLALTSRSIRSTLALPGQFKPRSHPNSSLTCWLIVRFSGSKRREASPSLAQQRQPVRSQKVRRFPGGGVFFFVWNSVSPQQPPALHCTPGIRNGKLVSLSRPVNRPGRALNTIHSPSCSGRAQVQPFRCIFIKVRRGPQTSSQACLQCLWRPLSLEVKKRSLHEHRSFWHIILLVRSRHFNFGQSAG